MVRIALDKRNNQLLRVYGVFGDVLYWFHWLLLQNYTHVICKKINVD
jgi:hypothetical protein